MGLLRTLRGANRMDDIAKAAKKSEEALKAAEKNAQALRASGKKGKSTEKALKLAEAEVERLKEIDKTTHEALESFNKTTNTRRWVAGGTAATAAGGGVVYGAYKYGQSNAQQPITTMKEAAQEISHQAEKVMGGPPIGMGTLIGAGLLGGLALLATGGNFLISAILAVVGAIGVQMYSNAQNSPKTEDGPVANTAANGKSAAEPQTNVMVDPQARTSPATENVMASVKTESLGELNTPQAFPAGGLATNKKKENSQRMPGQNGPAVG